jgi:hypothetical protein
MTKVRLEMRHKEWQDGGQVSASNWLIGFSLMPSRVDIVTYSERSDGKELDICPEAVSGITLEHSSTV